MNNNTTEMYSHLILIALLTLYCTILCKLKPFEYPKQLLIYFSVLQFMNVILMTGFWNSFSIKVLCERFDYYWLHIMKSLLSNYKTHIKRENNFNQNLPLRKYKSNIELSKIFRVSGPNTLRDLYLQFSTSPHHQLMRLDVDRGDSCRLITLPTCHGFFPVDFLHAKLRNVTNSSWTLHRLWAFDTREILEWKF